MEEDLFTIDDQTAFEAGGNGGYDALPVVPDSRRSANITRIMQPKTVTYADFHFSKIHNQIFIRIKEELQMYMEKDISRLKSNELIQIPLFCSHYPGFHGKTKQFYETIAKLMTDSNVVKFEWRFDASEHTDLYRWMMNAGHSGGSRPMNVPKDGALIRQASVLIVNVYRVEDDTDKLLVDINPKLVPFLLYYGKGNGGTAFNRDVALRLVSGFSYRLYYFLCDWVTSCSSKTMSLDELRSYLHYSEKYDVREINRRVLSVCKKELEDAKSDILFDYQFKYSPDYGFVEGTRGRLKSNCVVLTFSRKAKDDPSARRRMVLKMFLTDIADKEKAHLCDSVLDIIFEKSQDMTMENKFKFYSTRVKDGVISQKAYLNTMLKIVRETTGVDLRSDLHIRNAAISERRKSRSSSSSREPRPLGGIFGDLAGEE